MNNKIYFEMSEAERQLHLINNNLDFAICVLSEGLPGPEGQFKGITNDMYRELVENITDNLSMAFSGVNMLLESVIGSDEAEEANQEGR